MASEEGSIMALRHEYASCLKLADETDSKKEDAHLRGEAKVALDILRKMCPHMHTVCLQAEYAGSYIDDYDDKRRERRICLCCGTEEYAWNPDWKTLTQDPFTRIETDHPDQIKNPLRYLLTEAVEIAEEKGYRYFKVVR